MLVERASSAFLIPIFGGEFCVPKMLLYSFELKGLIHVLWMIRPNLYLFITTLFSYIHRTLPGFLTGSCTSHICRLCSSGMCHHHMTGWLVPNVLKHYGGLRTLGTSHLVTWHHITDERISQRHKRENLKILMIFTCFTA